MQQTNKDIVQHIATLEKNQSLASTSLASISSSQTQVHTDPLDSCLLASKQPNMLQAQGREPGSKQISSHSILGLGVRPHVNIQEPDHLTNPPLRQSTTATNQNPHHDSIIRNIDTLRQHTSISQAVSQLLATYKSQAKGDTIPQIFAILPLRKDGPVRVTLGVN